ncbi:MAG: winged helix-turn-helix domain-containing protein [Pseudomonadota bacterium]
MKYHFADFVLDDQRFELATKDGEALRLQMRALELLLLLVSQAGATVSKQTILREVWGRESVSRSALPNQILNLRRILGDDKEPHRLIQTVPGKGLRFIATTREEHGAQAKALATAAPLATPEFDLQDTPLVGTQPKVCVMKFTQVTPGDNLQGLATALPSDIIAAISRARVMRVIAGASSFLMHRERDAPECARSTLAADYCLTGHVSRSGEDYLIYVELTDTKSLSIVWAESFEVKREDVHDLRSNIVSQVVAQIERKVPIHEVSRLSLRQPSSLTAWQAFHIGSTLLLGRGPSNMKKARLMFERATSIDPGFARAWSGLAHTFAFDVIHQSSSDRLHAKKKLMQCARSAIDADPDDPSAHLFMGRAVSMNETSDDPIGWFSQALELAPSYAMAHQQLGSILTFGGESDQAMQHSMASLRLNPLDPVRYSNFAALAIANLGSGNFAKAVEWGQKAGQVPFDDLLVLVTGLCANHLGNKSQEAARIACRIKTAFPASSRGEILTRETLGDQLMPMVDGILRSYDID